MENNLTIYWWGREMSTNDYLARLVKLRLGDFSRIAWGRYKNDNGIKLSECSQCHSTSKNIDGHHTDYSRPLLITPLCKRCHVPYHKLKPSKYLDTAVLLELLAPDELVKFLMDDKEILPKLLERNNPDYLTHTFHDPTF